MPRKEEEKTLNCKSGNVSEVNIFQIFYQKIMYIYYTVVKKNLKFYFKK